MPLPGNYLVLVLPYSNWLKSQGVASGVTEVQGQRHLVLPRRGSRHMHSSSDIPMFFDPTIFAGPPAAAIGFRANREQR